MVMRVVGLSCTCHRLLFFAMLTGNEERNLQDFNRPEEYLSSGLYDMDHGMPHRKNVGILAVI